jgi:hypothetical protein
VGSGQRDAPPLERAGRPSRGAANVAQPQPMMTTRAATTSAMNATTLAASSTLTMPACWRAGALEKHDPVVTHVRIDAAGIAANCTARRSKTSWIVAGGHTGRLRACRRCVDAPC